MKITEYEDRYLEDVRDLLTELEEYIVSIDGDGLDRVHEDYREKMALAGLENVRANDGKCYLAVEDGRAVGLIMGTIPPYGEYDYLDYKCPKKGVITELVVAAGARGAGTGQALVEKLEAYFRARGCEYVSVDVFAYNGAAIDFYGRQGYHPRMYTDIKKL